MPELREITAVSAGISTILEKDCRWCGHRIPASARICKECKSYQSAWRSIAVYIASIASAIALLGSAITFIAVNWDATKRKLMSRDNVTLTYLNVLPGHDRRIVIFNNEDSPVFVTSVAIYWHGGSEDFPVEKTIQPREFAVINDKEDPSWHFDGFIGTAEGVLTESILQSSVNNSKRETGCVVTNFYNSSADDLQRMEKRYKLSGTKLVTDPAEAKVNYFTAQAAMPQVQSFPAVATFLRRDRQECKNKLK